MGGKQEHREGSLEALASHGGLRPGNVGAVHREIGVSEADLYGVATFYSLLSDPEAGRLR